MSPMLASVAASPFSDEDWLFELKWDGYRALAYLAAGCDPYLDSRNWKPLLPQYPVLSRLGVALRCKNALIDGEIVAMRDGKVSFSLLRSKGAPVVFVAFDILWMDGQSLIDSPLRERKEALEGALSWGGDAALSQVYDADGVSLYRFAKENDMEGVMAKRKVSVYVPGARSKDWLKVKNFREGTFWVVGYAPSPGRRIGSLVIAERDEECYRVVGRVSSGIDERLEKTLLERVRPTDAARPHSPSTAVKVGPSVKTKDVTWVTPFFGVEISFTEMTPDGSLRHPVLREVVAEDAG